MYKTPTHTHTHTCTNRYTSVCSVVFISSWDNAFSQNVEFGCENLISIISVPRRVALVVSVHLSYFRQRVARHQKCTRSSLTEQVASSPHIFLYWTKRLGLNCCNSLLNARPPVTNQKEKNAALPFAEASSIVR